MHHQIPSYRQTGCASRRRAELSTLLCMLALAYGGAHAQTTLDAVASPTAYAPPVLYRSVFVDTPTGIETNEHDWRQANAEVGQFKRGHVDILRWEEAQAKKAASAEPAPFATKNIAPHVHAAGAKP